MNAAGALEQCKRFVLVIAAGANTGRRRPARRPVMPLLQRFHPMAQALLSQGHGSRARLAHGRGTACVTNVSGASYGDWSWAWLHVCQPWPGRSERRSSGDHP